MRWPARSRREAGTIPLRLFPELDQQARDPLEIATVPREECGGVSNADGTDAEIVGGQADFLLAPLLEQGFRRWSVGKDRYLAEIAQRLLEELVRLFDRDSCFPRL